jgi:hypothetical protein
MARFRTVPVATVSGFQPVLTVCVLVCALGVDLPIATIRLVLEVRDCRSSRNPLGSDVRYWPKADMSLYIAKCISVVVDHMVQGPIVGRHRFGLSSHTVLFCRRRKWCRGLSAMASSRR